MIHTHTREALMIMYNKLRKKLNSEVSIISLSTRISGQKNLSNLYKIKCTRKIFMYVKQHDIVYTFFGHG